MGESIDGGLAAGITQAGQAHQESLEGIGCSTPEHPRVGRVLHRPDGDDHTPCAPQGRRQGRQARLDVARVGDDNRIRRHHVRTTPGEGLHASRTLLLRPLDDHSDFDRPVTTDLSKCFERQQDRQQVALAVGSSTAIPASVTLGQAPRITGPGRWVTNRHHIVMAVEQDRCRIRATSPPAHRQGAIRGLDRLDPVHPDRAHEFGDPLGSADALLDRFDRGVGHGAKRNETGELGPDPRHTLGDRHPQRVLVDHAHPFHAWTPTRRRTVAARDATRTTRHAGDRASPPSCARRGLRRISPSCRSSGRRAPSSGSG